MMLDAPLVLAAGEALSFTHRVVRPGLPTAAQPLIASSRMVAKHTILS